MLKVNLKKALFIYLIIYILFLSLGTFYLNLNTTEIIYDTSFIVSDRIGFDLNDSAITFGMIPQGNYGSRAINIVPQNYNQRIEIFSKGQISDFLIVNENSFVVPANSDKAVTFEAHVPQDIVFGKYDGEIKIKIIEFRT